MPAGFWTSGNGTISQPFLFKATTSKERSNIHKFDKTIKIEAITWGKKYYILHREYEKCNKPAWVSTSLFRELIFSVLIMSKGIWS